MRIRLAVTALCLLALAGCAKRRPAPRAPAPPAPGWSETGVASWYGDPYHGRRTASGEIYDMEQMTAAHRTLPFGANVRVDNLDNGRKAEVRINDRGPFVDGRIIDLSRAAARDIHMIGPGTARVRLHLLYYSPIASSNGAYALQVGRYTKLRNAERLRDRLRKKYATAEIDARPGSGKQWRVLIRGYGDEGEANSAAKILRKEYKDVSVVVAALPRLP